MLKFRLFETLEFLLAFRIRHSDGDAEKADGVCLRM